MARYPRCDTTGKMRFPDQGTAIDSALNTSRRSGGLPLRPYQCPDCDSWHLTKNPGTRYVATVPGPFSPADMARLLGRRQETA